MNLLFLSSSNHVQLIKSFKEAYKRLNLDGNIYSADINKNCASSLITKKHFIVPLSKSNDYFPRLKKIIESYKIDIVLSTRDEEIVLLSNNRELFEDLDCFLLASKKNSVSLCYDKLNLARFFAKNNISHPKTYKYGELKTLKSTKFPLICKPRYGKGSMGIFLARNFTVIKHQIIDTKNYIFQEYIKGHEYTVDVLNDLNEKILSIIPRKRVLVKGGESIISVTEKNQQIIDMTQNIVEKIGFIGHINLQCIIEDQQPYFIEINPRFGGASNTAFEAGMDSPYLILKMLTKDTPIKPFIGEFQNNLMILRYTQDFVVNLDDEKSENKKHFNISNR
jgi:carbamoyl-phosphate synthase large subunit